MRAPLVRWRPLLSLALPLFVLTVASYPSPAQDRAADVDALRREIEELRRADAEKQRKLDELLRRVEALSAGQPATRPASAGPNAEPPAGSPLDRAVADLPAAATPGTPPAAGTPSVAGPVPRDPTNRDIASQRVGGADVRLIDLSLDVLAAGGGSTVNDSSLQNLQGGGHDPRKNGFTLQNVELSLSGAVDPYFTGEAHLIYFIDPVEGESAFELEEAFVTTTRLPFGFQFEAGQFFTEFGRLNPRHPHQWEWMDQPVINTRLFGPDGMRGPGFRLGWLAPVPWYSEFHAGAQNANGETMGSFLAGEEFFEGRAIGNRPFVGRDVNAFNGLTYLLRWDNGFDLTDEWSAAAGASAVFGPNATGRDGNTAIYGADLVVKWRPARNNRGYPYFLSQTEVMYRDYRADDAEDEDGTPIAGTTLEDWGFYTQALYGWTAGWRGGVRFEYASGSGDSIGGRENDPFRDDRYRISPLVEWLPSEFSRVRLQYNYDRADHLEEDDAHSVWLGFEYLLGAHAAHRY